MSFADLKRETRQIVHETFAVPAYYTDTVHTGTPLQVRLHNRLARAENIGGTEFADILEGVDRIVFNRPDLAAAGVSLVRNGVLSFPDYGNTEFKLDTREPVDGPVTIIWNVVRV